MSARTEPTPAARRRRTRQALALAACLGAALAAAGPRAADALPARIAPAPAAGIGAARSVAAATTTTRPAVGAGALAVRIASLAPSIPAADDVVSVRGTVTNTSDAPVTRVSVALRVSPTPVLRGEIGQVVAGAGIRQGVRVAGSDLALAEELAPGQSVDFVLSVPVSQLGLGQRPGAYVTGVEVLGDSGAGVVRQDLDRTFLPWWPTATTTQPVLLTTLWPLTGRPERDASGVLPSEDLAVDMSPAGRLAVLVAAAAADPGAVTWVVDPEVVHAASEMATGYQVRSPDGTAAGVRAAEVTQWLSQVQRALADPEAHAVASLYAMPDVVAVRGSGLMSRMLTQRSAIDRRTRDILGVTLPSELALVPGGNADDATLASLARLSVAPVVLADTAFPTAREVFYTPSGVITWQADSRPLPVVLTDSGLSQALAMPAASAADASALRQRLLAETITITAELPSTQRLVVASPEPDWSPSAAVARAVVDTVASAPWIVPTPLSEALSREPSTVPRAHVAYGDPLATAELPDSHLSSVGAQLRGIAAYVRVLSDPTGLPLTTRTAPLRELGSWFRTRAVERDDLRRRVAGQVEAALGSVSVVSSGSITISGTAGTIPITVENTGTAAVTVGLTFSSTPAQLFTADPVPLVEIAPERRTSVEVPATVAGSGRIPVSVQVVTRDGVAFGPPAEIVVRSSAYASAARILVRASLALLVLAVTVHAVRRARRRRRAPSPADALPRSEVVSRG